MNTLMELYILDKQHVMKSILVFGNNQPCLDVIEEKGTKDSIWLGLNRDRSPDSGWDELRKTILKNSRQVNLTKELKVTLLEDLAYAFGQDTKKFNEKLKEFGFAE